jgi:hypothetical protein
VSQFRQRTTSAPCPPPLTRASLETPAVRATAILRSPKHLAAVERGFRNVATSFACSGALNPATGAGSRPQTVALSLCRLPTEKERPPRYWARPPAFVLIVRAEPTLVVAEEPESDTAPGCRSGNRSAFARGGSRLAQRSAVVASANPTRIRRAPRSARYSSRSSPAREARARGCPSPSEQLQSASRRCSGCY